MASTRFETLGRYVLIAPLTEGLVVLDLGSDDTRGAKLLLENDASAVVVAAPEDAPGDGDLEGLTLIDDATLPLPFDDAQFDLVVVHDLAQRLAADPAWMDELRRVLSPDGMLVTAVGNPSGQFLSTLIGETPSSPLSYSELYALVAPHFAATTMFGQSPVVANLFYDFDDDSQEPGLLFDRSLLDDDDDQAGWYVLIFGPQPVHRDDLAIVQQPFAAVAQAVAEASASTPSAELHAGAGTDFEQTRLALEHAEAKLEQASYQAEAERARYDAALEACEAQLRDLRQRLADTEAEGGGEAQRSEKTAAEIAHLEGALRSVEDSLRAQTMKTESALEQNHLIATTTQNVRDAYERASSELRALRTKIDLVDAQHETLVNQLQAQISNQEAQLTALRNELGSQTKERDDHVSEQQRSLEMLRQQLQQTTAQLDAVRLEHGKMAAKAEALETELASLQGTLTTLEARADASQNEAAQLREELTRRQEAYQAQALELQEQISHLTRAAETERLELSQQINTLAHAHQQEQQRSQQQEARALQLEAEHRQYNDRTHDSEQRMQQMAAELEKVAQLRLHDQDRANTLGQELESLLKTNAERASEAEAERARFRADRASLEEQIRDLLEEVAQLRSREQDFENTSAKLADLENLRIQLSDERAAKNNLLDAVQHERQRADELASRLMVLENAFEGIEQERRALADEAQRLTNLVHGAQQKPQPRHHDDETPIPTDVLALDFGASEAVQSATRHPERSTDAVGRQIESSLEDLEDLLASTQSPNSPRH